MLYRYSWEWNVPSQDYDSPRSGDVLRMYGGTDSSNIVLSALKLVKANLLVLALSVHVAVMNHHYPHNQAAQQIGEALGTLIQ